MGFIPPKAHVALYYPPERVVRGIGLRDVWVIRSLRGGNADFSALFWIAIVIALFCASKAKAETFRIWIDPTAKTHGWTHEQVVQGVELGCANWSKRADVQFEFVSDSTSADIRVYTKELYRPDLGKGTHVRGAQQGSNIWLHSGLIAPGHSIHGTRQWKAYHSLDSMSRIFGHELGHRFGWQHSSDPKCLMHSNASYWHCPAEVTRAQKQFGKPKAAMRAKKQPKLEPIRAKP